MRHQSGEKIFFPEIREGRYEIVTLVNGFHGRTLATLAATPDRRNFINISGLFPAVSSMPSPNLRP